MARSINANNINSAMTKALEKEELGFTSDKWYDLMWFVSASNDNWTDKSLAYEYMNDLDGIDEDTAMKGCRWTVLFALNAYSLIIIAVNSAIMAIGAYNFKARALGMSCGICLICLNLACIITTAVFRFNTMGKLASLSLTPSEYDASSPYLVSDSRTYNLDG